MPKRFSAAVATSRAGHHQQRSDLAGLHLASAPLPVGRLRHLEVVHASDVFDGPVAAAAMTAPPTRLVNSRLVKQAQAGAFLSLKSIIL